MRVQGSSVFAAFVSSGGASVGQYGPLVHLGYDWKFNERLQI